MTPTEIKATLAKIGGGANKRLGQHFLIEDAALLAIVDAAGIAPGDRVLEVGPGLGVLTRAMLDCGAEITAIEQDRRFMPQLASLPGSERLRVIHGDAATIHWHGLVGKNHGNSFQTSRMASPRSRCGRHYGRRSRRNASSSWFSGRLQNARSRAMEKRRCCH